jgi:hypothetical protein
MITPKMDRMAAKKILLFKRRKSYASATELTKGISQKCEIIIRGENNQIGVPAKLRGAVQYACLSTHE